MANDPRKKITMGAVVLMLAFLAIILLGGCAGTRALEPRGPSPQVVADASLCDEAGPLVIPMGTTPAQLHLLVYAAYLEVLALLEQCNKGERP